MYINKKGAATYCYVTAPSFVSCRTRIRTTTNRTKTCCATITPYDNHCVMTFHIGDAYEKRCKGSDNFLYYQIISDIFLLYCDKEVVFLATLRNNVLAVNEVF